jgi:hypothetical protein
LTEACAEAVDVRAASDIAFEFMRISPPLGLVVGFILPWLVGAAAAAEAGAQLENFEESYQAARWSFSNGPEFPGAKGSFERSTEAAHKG